MRDTDRPQRKVFKLQPACYVLDAAKRLAARRHRGAAREIRLVVSYSIAAVERRITAHHGFRIHTEKVVEAMVEAPPGTRRC